jgi:hypothetical protein
MKCTGTVQIRAPAHYQPAHQHSTNPCTGTVPTPNTENPISPVFKWPTRVLSSDLASPLPHGLASIHLQLKTDTGNSWMVSADVTSCVSVSSGLSRKSLAPHHPRTGYSYIFKVRAARTISKNVFKINGNSYRYSSRLARRIRRKNTRPCVVCNAKSEGIKGRSHVRPSVF